MFRVGKYETMLSPSLVSADSAVKELVIGRAEVSVSEVRSCLRDSVFLTMCNLVDK